MTLLYDSRRPLSRNRLALAAGRNGTEHSGKLSWKFVPPAVNRIPANGECRCGHGVEWHAEDGCLAPGPEECGCVRFRAMG